VPSEYLASYLKKIWRAENGRGRLDSRYFRYLADGVGVRDALNSLDSDLLGGPRDVPEACPTCGGWSTCRCEDPSKPRPPASDPEIFEARSAAALKAWDTRRAQQ